MVSKRKSVVFSCFSPAVMLATFVIEVALAVYVWLRYRSTAYSRLIVAILAILAVFQLSEYLICADQPDMFWARIGYVAITLLPVLGLQLISVATGRRHFLNIGYFTGAIFIVCFLFLPDAITGAVCGGNYLIFESAPFFTHAYSFYYLGFLILGLWEAAETIFQIRARVANKRIMRFLIAGYLVFMFPMGAIYLINPETIDGAASIMCGFAVIMALILAFKVAPAFKKRLGAPKKV